MALPKSYEDFDDIELEPLSEDELNWVEAHWDKLRQMCGGQWVAVDRDKVVAHGEKQVDVGKEVQAQGIRNPFYVWVLPHDEEPSVLIL